jgi:hypothetical protein
MRKERERAYAVKSTGAESLTDVASTAATCMRVR